MHRRMVCVALRAGVQGSARDRSRARPVRVLAVRAAIMDCNPTSYKTTTDGIWTIVQHTSKSTTWTVILHYTAANMDYYPTY